MSSIDVPEACPHCDDAPPSLQLDAHVARTHADLPPCTARIETAHGETYTCGFRAGHARGEYGTWHASKRGADMGRYIWNDTATGATPHRPPEQSDADVLAKFKRMGAVSHTVVATSEVPDSQDTGSRCPRCDCPDGHTQCDHCKVCPHADGGPKEPTHLTYEQLLPVVAAVYRREAYAPAGAVFLLPPFPDCPTCGQPPAELFVRNDHPAQFLKDEVGFGFRPCGHTFTADGEDLFRAYDQARREAP